MKVTLPEHIGEITLGQYQKFSELDSGVGEVAYKKNVVSVFCDVDLNIVSQFPMVQINEFYEQIKKALNEPCDFQMTFKMDGVEFGFHPNLDQMNGSEFGEFQNYCNDVKEYHRMLAVLYRPIAKKDKFGNYKLVKYNGTSEYAEKMRAFPMSVVNGVMVFFLNLKNELYQSTQKYISKAQAKEQKQATTLRSGVGMQPL